MTRDEAVAWVKAHEALEFDGVVDALVELTSRATPQTLDGATATCKPWRGKFNPGRGVYWKLDDDRREFCSEACMYRALSPRTDGPPATPLGTWNVHTVNGDCEVTRPLPSATQGVSARPARDVAHEAALEAMDQWQRRNRPDLQGIVETVLLAALEADRATRTTKEMP